MGACASVTKAMRGKADDDKAPLPEPAVDLPEVTAGEGDKVEKTIESDKVVVVDDQTPNKVEEPEKKEEQKTTAEAEDLPKAATAEAEELPKAAAATAAEETGKCADNTSEVKEEK